MTRGDYRLLTYYDMRPFDWLTGKRVPLGPGEGHECDRCGRLHAHCYRVLHIPSGKEYVVGSGCCARAFDGWEPGKEEVQRAKQRERSETKKRAHEELVQRATEHAVSMLPVVYRMPEIVVVKATPPDVEWGSRAWHVYWGFREQPPWPAIAVPADQSCHSERAVSELRLRGEERRYVETQALEALACSETEKALGNYSRMALYGKTPAGDYRRTLLSVWLRES